MLEFSTSEGETIDAEAWIDPEVVKLNGISLEELEKYKKPPAFESQGGSVQNPEVDLNNPPMQFPPGQEVVYSMSDKDVTEKIERDDTARPAESVTPRFRLVRSRARSATAGGDMAAQQESPQSQLIAVNDFAWQELMPGVQARNLWVDEKNQPAGADDTDHTRPANAHPQACG